MLSDYKQENEKQYKDITALIKLKSRCTVMEAVGIL